jgi:Rieske Fe-S protein
MNRRMTQTCKILAVAVAAAGCSSAAPPEARVEPPATATAAAAPTTPQETKVAAVPTTPPPPPEDPKLIALRSELASVDTKEAEQKKGHFRPLCDADGYPLVGNVVRKGDRGVVPSLFCAFVRKAK